jgi:hypothetical protein
VLMAAKVGMIFDAGNSTAGSFRSMYL